MANLYLPNLYLPWVATGSKTYLACERQEHVLVRGWSGVDLPALLRSESFDAVSAAEAALQHQLEQRRRVVPTYRHHPPTSVITLLAAEVAAQPHDSKTWRNYADWAWRHADPRGALVELHEAAEQARSPAHAAHIQQDIEAHEQAHFGAWRRELIAAHRRSAGAGELRFQRGHLLAVSGFPTFELDAKAPAAIAELSFELSYASELERLAVTLARAEWGSLQRCAIRLACRLDDDQGAKLIDLLWQTKPRLTSLELCAAPGAMTFGPRTLASLARLLTRHCGVICGVALERLTIDFDDPADGWTLGRVSELIDVLAPSGLRELELRLPTIPEDLRAWAQCSGFAQGLAHFVLRARRVAVRSGVQTGIASGMRTLAPPRAVEPESAELLVWADWLQARGDPLGELALLWSLSNDGPAEVWREQIGRARARVEHELEGGRGAVEVMWSGPLIERVLVHGSKLAAKHGAAAVLEHVLGSPACARLGELQLRDVENETLACLVRVASNPDHAAHAVLDGLNALTLECRDGVDLSPLLDALPKLERLTCRSPNIGLGQHRPHPQLRALTLTVAGDLDRHGLTELFDALDADALPGLRTLTLELGERWRGRALPFHRLSLPPGVHLTIRGRLRETDSDGLTRWAATAELQTLEIADAQRSEAGRHVHQRAPRVPGMQLLGMQARHDQATQSSRPWHTLVSSRPIPQAESSAQR
jgi:hypothetical protein